MLRKSTLPDPAAPYFFDDATEAVGQPLISPYTYVFPQKVMGCTCMVLAPAEWVRKRNVSKAETTMPVNSLEALDPQVVMTLWFRVNPHGSGRHLCVSFLRPHPPKNVPKSDLEDQKSHYPLPVDTDVGMVAE